MKHNLVVVLLAGLLLAPGAVRSQGGGSWIRIESESFTFYSDSSEDIALTIAYNLEEMRHVFSQMWSLTRLDAPVPTRFYIFADDSSFAPFRLRGDEMAGYLVPHEHGYYAAVIGHPRLATRAPRLQGVHPPAVARQLSGIPAVVSPRIGRVLQHF